MATSVSLTILSANPTSTFPGSPTSTPTNNFGSSGGSSGNVRSVSYFFGFLIAIIAVLLFFIGCGIGARRGIIRRRLLAMGRDEETGDFFVNEQVSSRVSPPKEPTLWETTFEKGSGQWESIMPLSVAVIPEGDDGTLSPPPYTPSSMPNWLRPQEPIHRSSSWGNVMHPILTRWIPQFSRRQAMTELSLGTIPQMSSQHSEPSLAHTSDRKRVPPDSTDLPPKKPPEYQVVVMISMPSQHASKEGLLGDVQFGVTKLPIT